MEHNRLSALLLDGWKQQPDAQDWWWLWDGDEETNPFVYSVMAGHTGGPYFFIHISPDQPINCQEMEGVWKRIPRPNMVGAENETMRKKVRHLEKAARRKTP